MKIAKIYVCRFAALIGLVFGLFGLQTASAAFSVSAEAVSGSQVDLTFGPWPGTLVTGSPGSTFYTTNPETGRTGNFSLRSSAEISWYQGEPSFTGYPFETSLTIYRGPSSSGPWTRISGWRGTADNAPTIYSDTIVTQESTYYYLVRVWLDGYMGSDLIIAFYRDTIVSATTPAVPVAPASPANVSASQGTVTGQVVLSWSAVPDASNYQVFRSETSGQLGNEIGTVTGTSFQDSIASASSYYYTVVAQNAGGNSDPSEQAVGFANFAPISASAAIRATSGQTTTPVTPAVNDPNPGDTFTFMIASQPANGTAAVFEGGLVYTPNDGYSGSDTFAFTATDAAGASVTGTAEVVVEEPQEDEEDQSGQDDQGDGSGLGSGSSGGDAAEPGTVYKYRLVI